MTARSGICAWIASRALMVALASLLSLACSESGTTGPGDTGAEGGDRTPPGPIVDLALTYPVVGGSAFMTWTAPNNGGAHDAVDRYEIRYSYSSPLAWENAASIDDPPAPAAAGEEQNYEFKEPHRGRDLYAAVRSFDAADNASAISEVAHVYVAGLELEGSCTDALSQEPVEGLAVEVTERHVHTMATDAQGRYSLVDLSTGVTHVSLRSGPSTARYHHYDRTLELAKDESLTHYVVEYMPTELPAGDNVLALLLRAVNYSSQRRFLKKWKSFPIDVYVPAFVNESGVDYEDYCRRAVEHWNERVGSVLFRLVDEVPETGVWFQFKTRQEMQPLIGVTHHENDEDGYPKTSDISIVDDLDGTELLWTVALHELGHTIRLAHLPQGYLMYAGQPLPQTVTNDEVMVVKLYLGLPNGTNLSLYDVSAPD